MAGSTGGRRYVPRILKVGVFPVFKSVTHDKDGEYDFTYDSLGNELSGERVL